MAAVRRLMSVLLLPGIVVFSGCAFTPSRAVVEAELTSPAPSEMDTGREGKPSRLPARYEGHIPDTHPLPPFSPPESNVDYLCVMAVVPMMVPRRCITVLM